MSLKKLPNEIQSLMCASIHINTFKRAVEELVYNALDAQSTSIAIRVHINDGALHVIDNGRGIHKLDFDLLGQMYATSHYVDKTTLESGSNKYGLAGVSLANIIEVSKYIKITSRHESGEEAWVKEFCKNKVKKPYGRIKRPSKGTTIQIKGFLYNKCIIKKSLNALREFQEIKTFLEQISVVHTSISLSLRDEEKNEIAFQVHKTRDVYKTLNVLFNIQRCDLQEFIVEKNHYKVTGFIGKKEICIKLQWIFHNNKFVSRNNKVYKLLKEYLKTTKRKRKIDYKGCDEEYNLKYKISFYLIFIQSPLTDYVTKGSYLEFKNWEIVKKLLQKLVQFYFGNIQLKEISVNPIDKKNVKPQADIRDQVKIIMERFLSSRKLGVSQLQNGITGKLVNRKRSRRSLRSVGNQISKLDIPIEIEQKNPNVELCENKNYNKGIVTDLKRNSGIENDRLIGKSRSENNNNHIILPQRVKKRAPDDKTKAKHKNIQAERKIKAKKNKQNTINDSIIQRFIKPTDSVQKRCDIISRKAQEALNHIKPKKQQILIKENVYNSNTFQGNKQISVRKRVNEIVIHDYLPLPPKIDRKNIDSHYIKTRDRCLCTYDLINTILQSQGVRHEIQNDKYQITQTQRKASEIAEHTQLLPSYLTFQSHCHAMNMEVLENLGKFVPKQNACSKKSNLELSSSPTRNQNQSKQKSNFNIEDTPIGGTSSFKNASIKLKSNLEDPIANKMLSSQSLQESNFQSGHFGNIKKTYIVSNDNSNNISLRNPDGENYLKENMIINETIPLSISIDRDNFSYNDLTLPNTQENPNIDNLINIDPMDICETVMSGVEKEITTLSSSSKTEMNNKNSIIDRSDVNNKQNKKIDIVSHYSDSLECPNININLIDNANTRLRSSYFDNRTADNTKSDKINKLESVAQDICVATEIHFGMKSRLRFIPKGMSQIFENCNSKGVCSYNFEEDYFENNLYDDFDNNVQMNSNMFDPILQELWNNATTGIEKLTKKIDKENTSLKFDAQSIKSAKVLGQVDYKFIAAIVNGKNYNKKEAVESLVLFDQHAVDERIRLEKNLSEYLQKQQWKKVNIDDVHLTLNKDEILYLHNYKDKLSRLGIEWNILGNDQIILSSVPQSILGKIPRQMEKVVEAVKKIIAEEINIIKQQSGCISLYPKAIMDLVFSEACRYAIKFGDKLSMGQCEDMLNALSECKMPFQCAHGRPVMAVLIDVVKNNNEYKINLSKLKEYKLKNLIRRI
ncbi:uncharacterized protein LOC114246473 isoform X2 [Bombyx mandarina]|uniref:Uncharacterized protein LOC114246473 isoform X2 n=1 Tax=Bombyx mandarina TaxID=7092 RepID=A0A6J2JYY4_BOMMA|nr:uncharacterized protein LOC114246473 isoform X2 [Bombyx mandarina]